MRGGGRGGGVGVGYRKQRVSQGPQTEGQASGPDITPNPDAHEQSAQDAETLERRGPSGAGPV